MTVKAVLPAGLASTFAGEALGIDSTRINPSEKGRLAYAGLGADFGAVYATGSWLWQMLNCLVEDSPKILHLTMKGSNAPLEGLMFH